MWSEIVNESNGLVFKFDSEEDLLSKIDRISQIDYYNELRKISANLISQKLSEGK